MRDESKEDLTIGVFGLFWLFTAFGSVFFWALVIWLLVRCVFA